jgi:hypothetical protein
MPHQYPAPGNRFIAPFADTMVSEDIHASEPVVVLQKTFTGMFIAALRFAADMPL